MDYEKLKEEIKQIADIAASVPEQFRDKCFELLLTNLVQANAGERRDERKTEPERKAGSGTEGADTAEKLPPPPPRKDGSKITLTTQLRLLMRRTTLNEEEIGSVIMQGDDGDVHFVREPHNVPLAQGQIEWALLLALKNAIKNDSMTVDPEDVRSVCQEKGFYDRANFASIFKRPNYSKYFKEALVPQGQAQPLTADGQDALGKLVKRLAIQTQ